MNEDKKEHGHVGRKHTAETRAKIAASMAGNKNARTPSKYKAVKKRKVKAKRRLTEEHKEKIRIAMIRNCNARRKWDKG